MPWDTPFVDTIWDDCDAHWTRDGVGVVPGTMRYYAGPYPDPALQELVGNQQEWQEGLDYDKWLAGEYQAPNGCWARGLRIKPKIEVEVSSPSPFTEAGVEASGVGAVATGSPVAGLEAGGTFTLEYGVNDGPLAASGDAVVTRPVFYEGGVEAGGYGDVAGTFPIDGLGELEAGGTGDVVTDASNEYVAGLEAGGTGDVVTAAVLAMLGGLEAGGWGAVAESVILAMLGGLEAGGTGLEGTSIPVGAAGGVEAGGTFTVGDYFPYAMGGGLEAGGTYDLVWNPLMKGEILGQSRQLQAESTSSTSFVALTNADSVTFTLDVTGSIIAYFFYQTANTGIVSNTSSVFLDGTEDTSSPQAVQIKAANQYSANALVYVFPSITAGSRTIAVRHKVPSGTGTWRYRELVIVRN